MAIFINLIIIVIYLIGIAWMWQNLEDLEKNKKVIVILIGLMLMYIVTNIIFAISKETINYENVKMKNNVGKIIVRLFTGLNVFFIPIAIKNIMKVKNGEQDENTFKIKSFIIIMIFIICMFVENGYMKNIQNGILDVYKSNKTNEISNESENVK